MNKLLSWDLAIFLKKLRCKLDFKFWDAPSLTFPTHLENTRSLVFIWAWSWIFISETVVRQISRLFMFQATHTWFIVAQVMSFGEWLSIIARSELGSDLDCSVINARSELGSDLDCYELIPIFNYQEYVTCCPNMGLIPRPKSNLKITLIWNLRANFPWSACSLKELGTKLTPNRPGQQCVESIVIIILSKYGYSSMV